MGLIYVFAVLISRSMVKCFLACCIMLVLLMILVGALLGLDAVLNLIF